MASILKVDTIQDQSGNNIINENADTITIGASGDTITIPSGATLGAGMGKVLQVVQTFKSDAFSSTADGFFDITGLSVAITPSSASNKVLVISDLAIGSSDLNSFNHGFKVLRGATDVGISTAGSTNFSGGVNMYLSGGQYPYLFGNMKMFLDSPATTSAITYKIQGTKISADGTFYVNRKGSGTDVGGTSAITVMEIAV
jgi:hypothetical protein